MKKILGEVRSATEVVARIPRALPDFETRRF